MMKQKSGKDKKPAQIIQLERDDVRVWSMYIVACTMSPSGTELIFLSVPETPKATFSGE